MTNEETHKSHVHKLMGRNCNEDGICITPLNENYTAIFQNLGILFVGKKEVPEILYQRKLEEMRLIPILNDPLYHSSDSEKSKLREEAEKEAKDMNLNCVRIAFEAYDCSHELRYPMAGPVYSRAVANQSKYFDPQGKERTFLLPSSLTLKSTKSELVIIEGIYSTRLTHYSSSKTLGTFIIFTLFHYFFFVSLLTNRIT